MKSEMQEEIEEVVEIDPLRPIKEIKSVQKESLPSQKLDENELLRQFTSFLSRIRRDLGANVQIEEEKAEIYDKNLKIIPEKRQILSRKAKTKEIKDNPPPPSKKSPQNIIKSNILCDICGKVNKTPQQQATHMKLHTNSRNHECPICSKRFKSASDLKRHVTDIHENIKDLICDICDKRLRSKKSMRKHMIQFHMSTLALKCPECQRPFGDKSRLTRHLKVHKRARGEFIEEIKKEECGICHKLFGNSTHLKQHMGKHTNERRFKCSICSAAFNFHSSMRNHERKVHEGKGKKKDKAQKVPVKVEIESTMQLIVTNDVIYEIPFTEFQ